MRFGLQISVFAVGALLGDCGRPLGHDRDRLAETVPARCDVGGKPGYFVPSTRPPVLIGCARLGVSGKRVEFSTDRTRIDGESHVCINPAYFGRTHFIPAGCLPRPSLSRFAIRDASQPRQGVRGYEFVIWGTAPAGTKTVVARAGAVVARAAVFGVPPGVTAPSFAVFVFELPLSAPCDELILVANGAGARSMTSSCP